MSCLRRQILLNGLASPPKSSMAQNMLVRRINYHVIQQYARTISTIRRPLLRPTKFHSATLHFETKRPYSYEYEESNQHEAPRSSRLLVKTIIGSCTLIYLWTFSTARQVRKYGSLEAQHTWDSIHKHMVLSLRNFQEGRYYTLITSAFTHVNLMHVAFNMMSLYSLAPMITVAYGTTAFASIYFGSLVSGGLAQLWWWSTHPDYTGMERAAIGASGGVFGLFAAIACTAPRAPMGIMFIPYPFPTAFLAFAAAGFSAASIREGWFPWISHTGHLGGMAFGVLYWALAMRKRRAPRSPPGSPPSSLPRSSPRPPRQVWSRR